MRPTQGQFPDLYGPVVELSLTLLVGITMQRTMTGKRGSQNPSAIPGLKQK